MSWDWARLEAKFDGVKIQRVRFVTVAGTWSRPEWGFQADVARGLNDERFEWVPVEYPASFGPINPPFPGAPSYQDSVQVGVEATIRAIEKSSAPFILSGYSQGAEVAGRVCIELIEGVLRHRRADCLGSVTFGDPARQATDESYGGGTGTGISKLEIPRGIKRVTYAVKGDMYCTIPEGTTGDQMHAVYLALTRMGDGKINGHTALLQEVLKILNNPLAGGIAAIDAIIRALQVAQHGAYGPWVPHAIEQVARMAAHN